MRIGWYSHHITNDLKTPVRASVGQEHLFTGRFAGGAEMSDWEYKQHCPTGWDIETVTPATFDNYDLAEFDTILVTGTDLFTDQQLFKLSEWQPMVFVHHKQEPRESLAALIAGSRLFVTHTPRHMMIELMWANPKRTAQVLSAFDTTNIQPGEKEPFAFWAARNHPLKGKLQAEIWAAKKGIDLVSYTDVERDAVLETMSHAEWFVHLPIAFESECRAVMEAVLSGCKLAVNDNVGITSVTDWDDPEHLRNMIEKAGETFWKLVQM